jgi:hypothetical protein
MVMMFCVGKSFSNVFCGRKICEEWNKYRITVEVLIYFFFVRIHVFFLSTHVGFLFFLDKFLHAKVCQQNQIRRLINRRTNRLETFLFLSASSILVG